MESGFRGFRTGEWFGRIMRGKIMGAIQGEDEMGERGMGQRVRGMGFVGGGAEWGIKFSFIAVLCQSL